MSNSETQYTVAPVSRLWRVIQPKRALDGRIDGTVELEVVAWLVRVSSLVGAEPYTRTTPLTIQRLDMKWALVNPDGSIEAPDGQLFRARDDLLEQWKEQEKLETERCSRRAHNGL
jgi:hypothetical protein